MTATITPQLYTDVLDELMLTLGNQTATAVLGAYQSWQSGSLTTSQFEELVAQIVAVVNANARGGADIIATRAVQDLTGQPHAVPAGVPAVSPTAEMERLGKAAATFAGLLDTADDLTDRLARFGRDEPAHAVQQQVQHTYRGHGIEGYVRGLNGSACELCIWLKKEHLRPGGFVYPLGQPMHRHTGCRCTPIPTTKEIDHE